MKAETKSKATEKLYFLVEEEAEEERIDKYIHGLIDSLSRSYIQKLLKDEAVLVNNCPIKANYRLKAGDEIFLQIPPSIEPDIEPEDIPLDILYEDKDILIINKPKNMVVHPAAGHFSGTVVNAVLYHCKGNLSGINGVMRPGIVHRIDKDTTGSLIICKNDMAHQHIAAQLKEHTITRCYRAICHGVLKDDDYVIHKPIGRHPADRKKMAVNERNGKDAITHVKVLQRFEKYTYIECRLETGRTHQIRVHLSSIGHPLLGDSTYGSPSSPFHLEGQTLHAMTLGIRHPKTEEYLEVNAPLPEYFEHLLHILH